MKLHASLFLLTPFLLPACVEPAVDEAAPISGAELPAAGTAHVWTPGGVLEVAYERVGTDKVVFQEDMMVSIDEFTGAMLDEADVERVLAGDDDGLSRAAVRAIGRYRWPGGVVVWDYGANVTALQQQQFQLAMNHWTANTPIRFTRRTNQTDFVEIRPGDGNGICRADVGRQGGEQELEADNCGWATLVHELGHTIGFYHEQTRFDRDSHVTILWDNIQSNRKLDFYKYVDHPQGRDGADAGPYDYNSIMHYGQFSGSIDPPGTPNRRETIRTWPAGIAIGQRNGLSAGDIDAARRMVDPGGVVDGGGEGVTLYADASFGGALQNFQPGVYSVQNGTFGTLLDNTASSVRVPNGWAVELYVAPDLGSSSIWLGGSQGTSATLPAMFTDSVSSLDVRRAVTTFREPSRTGVTQTFRVGEHKANAGHLYQVGNDQISSILVPPGLLAELCWSETGAGSTGGYCSTYEGGITLGSFMDNQTSLVRVKRAATVYTDANFLGIQKSLPIGTWINTDLAPVPNDRISSIIVGEGLQARLCDSAAGGGTCEVFRGDVTYIGAALNDRVTWIRIEPNTAP